MVFGLLSNGTAYAQNLVIEDNSVFKGELFAASGTLGTITAGTITGTTISGNTITGGTISGTTVSGTTITGGSISGTTITGGLIRTASSGYRTELDDGTYMIWSGTGSKTDANGIFWVKKDGTGFIKGEFFQGEILETKTNGFSNTGSSTGSATVTHNSAGKAVTVSFLGVLKLEMAGDKRNQADKLELKIVVKRNGTIIDTLSVNPSFSFYINEPEIGVDKTTFSLRGNSFYLDTNTSVGNRNYTVECTFINNGASGTVAIPSISGSIKTEENKLA
jgi:hypothetical protein